MSPQVPAGPSATDKVRADISAARKLIAAEDGMTALTAELGDFAKGTPQYQDLAKTIADNEAVRELAQALRNKTTTEAEMEASAEAANRDARRQTFQDAIDNIRAGADSLHNALANGGAVALEVSFTDRLSRPSHGLARLEFGTNGQSMTVTITAPAFLLNWYGKTPDGRDKKFTIAPPRFTANSGPDLHETLRQALQDRWTYEEQGLERTRKIEDLRTRSQALQAEEKRRLASGNATVTKILKGEAGEKAWVNPKVRLFYSDGKPVIERGTTNAQATAVMTYHIESDGVSITLKEVVAYRVPEALTALIGKPVPLADLGNPEHKALKEILDNRAKYEAFQSTKASDTEAPTAAPEATTGKANESLNPAAS
jgi:hypothetical protein